MKNMCTLMKRPKKSVHTDRCLLKTLCTLVEDPGKGVHSGRWLSKKGCTLTDDPQKKCAPWSMTPCPECTVTFCHEHSHMHTVHSRAQTVPLMVPVEEAYTTCILPPPPRPIPQKHILGLQATPCREASTGPFQRTTRSIIQAHVQTVTGI